jgi:TatA/E family protein of Tat protein translocase
MNTLFILLLLDDVSTGELLIVLLAVFILFGPKKIPDIAKGLAKGIRDIRNAGNDIQEEVNETMEPIKKELQGSVDKLKGKLDFNANDNSKKPSMKSNEIKKDFIG